MAYSQRPKQWAALVKQFDTRIIWQYRENSLKQSVGEYSYRYYNDSSILEGLKSKQEIKNRCSVGAGCSFVINDFDYFHRMLRNSLYSDWQISSATHVVAKHPSCIHRLSYEDYLYHREGSMLDLFNFLGIAPIQSNPQRFKATSDNMCEVVKNWNDLCNMFYGCATWRRYFEDDVNGCTCRSTRSPFRYCDASHIQSVR